MVEQEEFFQNFHDALVAVGIVWTGDTGQLAGFTGLTVSSTAIHGHRIYRFDDSLQSTSPVFFRVRFGINYASGSSIPTIAVQMGTGTDGAGNLVNASTLLTSATYGGTSSSALGTSAIPIRTTTSYVSAGPGYLWAVLHAGAVIGVQRNPNTSAPGRPEPIDMPLVFFAICRKADASGSPLAGGLSMLTTQGVAGYTPNRIGCYSLGNDNSERYGDQAFSAPWLDAAPSQGGKVAVARGYGWYAGADAALSPLFAFAAVGNQSMSEGDTVVMPVYGSTPRTFLLPDRGCGPMTRTRDNTLAQSAFLGLWEGPTV